MSDWIQAVEADGVTDWVSPRVDTGFPAVSCLPTHRLAVWAPTGASMGRFSLVGKDGPIKVSTDTFLLEEAARLFQLRLRLLATDHRTSGRQLGVL